MKLATATVRIGGSGSREKVQIRLGYTQPGGRMLYRTLGARGELSTPEAALLLKVTPMRLMRMIARGELVTKQRGRSRFLKACDVLRVRRSLSRGAADRKTAQRPGRPV